MTTLLACRKMSIETLQSFASICKNGNNYIYPSLYISLIFVEDTNARSKQQHISKVCSR